MGIASPELRGVDMGKQIMRRRAADNVYLHKDFHGAMSAGIQYLEERYGADAVVEYLRQFTRAYYAPLTAAIRQRGLVALQEHLERMYEQEGGTVRIALSDDELLLEVEACPAVSHMRERGYSVARMFVETTRTVHEALLEGTAFAFELLEYEPQSGRSRQRFYRSGA